MAASEIQINALPQASVPLDLTDIFHLKQGIEDKRCTLEQLLAPHATLTNNPHKTTKAHVGLSNVLNEVQLVASKNLADVPDVDEARRNLKIQSAEEIQEIFNKHVLDYNNPHKTTPAKIGLGNIKNWPTSNQYNEDADKYATARAVNALYKAIQASFPVGSIHLSMNPANPSTYMICGGTWELVSKGRSLVGYENDDRKAGTTFGSKAVVLTENNLPSHSHTVNLSGGSHTHAATVTLTPFDYGTKGTTAFDYGTKGTNETGGHTHTFSGSSASDGQHDHMVGMRINASYYAGIFEYPVGNSSQSAKPQMQNGAGVGLGSYSALPKTNAAGGHTHTFSGTTSNAGNHSHSVAIGAHSHNVAIGAHNHAATAQITASEHTHSGTTGLTGAGQAVSIEQPSFVVYVWQRTA
nr:MAG TPA: structural protein [Caudoviricetes sp.]